MRAQNLTKGLADVGYLVSSGGCPSIAGQLFLFLLPTTATITITTDDEENQNRILIVVALE
jgi:hypothetical protein